MKKALIILLLVSCIEPFDPIVIGNRRVLVVDATVANIPESSYVQLTYSFPIDGSVAEVASGATVRVIDEDGIEEDFIETDPGVYTPALNFAGTVGRKYQLQVITADGNEYISSEEELLPPAVVDSVYGRFLTIPSEEGSFDQGVQFFADIVGTSDEIHNFRIEYEEDYRISVPFPSFFEYDPVSSTIDLRESSLRVCYANNSSSSLLIGTTSGQINSELREFPIVLIKEDEPDLIGRYSLTVKPFRISSAAYQYYKDLQEINESGSFFDRQKGLLIGNIMNANDPVDAVLGYFEVASVSQGFEIFEGRQWVDEGFRSAQILRECINTIDTIPTIEILNGDYNFRNTLITTFEPSFGNIVVEGVEYPPMLFLAPEECSDCRLYGTLEKPAFWD